MKCVCCIFLIVLTSFFAAAKQYDVFEENGKVGLKDDKGEVLIPAQYESLGWSDNQFTVIEKVTGYKHHGLWGLIRLDNHRVTKAEYEELMPAEASLILARKKSTLSLRLMTGCINASGKEIIPFLYDGLKVSALRAVVLSITNNQFKYGLIDLSNKIIIPISYSGIYPLGSLRYAVENSEKKLAIFSDIGKQLSEFTIDSISSFQKNYAIVYQNQKQGLIDRDGQFKTEAKYRELKIMDDGSVQAREIDEWIFLDGKNQTLRKFKTDSIIPLGNDLFKVSHAGQVRFTDGQFKTIGDGPFSFIGTFTNGKALVEIDHKVGLVKINGSLLIKPKYTHLRWSRQFVIAGLKSDGKNKWIVLDSLGNQKTSRLYDRIDDFNGIFFPVRNHNRWGAVDAQGKEFIACVYDSLIQQKGDHIAVKFQGQYGIINLREEWVVTPKVNRSQLVDNEHYIERTEKTWFLKSYDGSIIYFSDNEFEVKEDFILEYLTSGNIWKIDLQGRIADRQMKPEESVERIFEEKEGLRAIQRDGKYGFVDNRGRLRIANRYDDIQSFTEGLAGAKIRGKWGFINHQDKIAIQPAYEAVTPFARGFSLVKLKGLKGLIDLTGKQILPPRYDNIEVLESNRLRITQNNFAGLADASGKILINPKYDHLEDLNNGYVIIERQGQFGLINLQGISTIPLMYDALIYNRYQDQFIALKKSPWLALKLN